jgi:hypothetical protein
MSVTSHSTGATTLYLDLMKRCLINSIYEHDENMLQGATYTHEAGTGRIKFQSGERIAPELRLQGKAWPSIAHTMIGLYRLDNLQACMEEVLRKDIRGDFIETGVWRGGATIFMRALLKAYGVTDRLVWVADSFEGLPPSDTARYPQDAALDYASRLDMLSIPLEVVRDNFQRYGLLDEQVKFLSGWFKDTLPTAPMQQLALLRLDGDFYESTMDALTNLYDKVSIGGFVIVDDYNSVPACKQAIHDFRRHRNIGAELLPIDDHAVYWQRQ